MTHTICMTQVRVADEKQGHNKHYYQTQDVIGNEKNLYKDK